MTLSFSPHKVPLLDHNRKFLDIYVNVQLSQKFQLPDRATRIRNLVAPIKFLIALGRQAAVNVEP